MNLRQLKKKTYQATLSPVASSHHALKTSKSRETKTSSRMRNPSQHGSSSKDLTLSGTLKVGGKKQSKKSGDLKPHAPVLTVKKSGDSGTHAPVPTVEKSRDSGTHAPVLAVEEGRDIKSHGHTKNPGNHGPTNELGTHGQEDGYKTPEEQEESRED